jgi:hypothetical protein
MPNFFSHFETTSQAERAEMARNLQKLYNRFYTEENESFAALREAKSPGLYTDAQKRYAAAVSKLGTIQAVFHELGIEFDGLYDPEV